MKFDRRSLRFLAIAIAFAGFSQHARAQKPDAQGNDQLLESVSVKTDIYPADADANKEIQAALKEAATGKKQVLLVFGANWCYDCHVLDRALHEGAAAKIVKENYLLVHVDIGEGQKNADLVKTYRIPLEKGVPALAILGADGKMRYNSAYGEFEAARRMMKKDLVAFLEYWKPGSRQ
jgi:thiol:disulfide interchange protein